MGSYASVTDYNNLGHGILPNGEELVYLEEASMNIDAITYNRIHRITYDKLTRFQKDIVKKCVCLQAEFNFENADMLNTSISSYSINGVSVNYGAGIGSVNVGGTYIAQQVYQLMKQTGLMVGVI